MKFRNKTRRHLPINKKIIQLILPLLFLFTMPFTALGASGWGCFGVTVAEYIIPGLGYGILGQYDKMIVLGGARWMALNKYVAYSESPDYEPEFEKIFKSTELADDKVQSDIFYSRETFFANAYASIYSNLTYATFYDLYAGGCKSNPKTYGEILAPFQIWEYGSSLRFWAPTLYISAVPLETDLINYHVDSDLTRQEMIDTSFVQYQLVGVGEEMLFRGMIQRSLYNWFSGGLSKGGARWASILAASAIFGAAHSGAGFTATPGIAFGAGVYLGWVYHPADGDFNLIEPIAIHSWWDTILVTRQLQGANFVERQAGENALTYTLKMNRVYPLFGFNISF